MILKYIAIAYFSVGTIVCIAMLSDFIEEDQGEDSLLKHFLLFIRSFAFCLFLSPGYLAYLLLSDTFKYIIRKVKNGRRNEST
jgi:hypothetical protein